MQEEKEEMLEYRNNWKYAREHKFIPKVPFPNSMKTNCRVSDEQV